MLKGNILVIDDEESLRKLLSRIISLEGYKVSEAGSVKEGLRFLDQHETALVISDVKLPDGNGVDLTQTIKSKFPETEIIVLTAFGNIQDAVQAIKNGAYDYLVKGDDNNKIIPLINKAVDKALLQYKIKELQQKLSGNYSFENIIGDSDPIQKAISEAKKVAVTDTSVLLTGETGTGKELFAHAIHHAGKRRSRPFVAINCSAFSKEILESELFGHKAGAFTGAIKDKKGLLEEAHEGTLFLDEIGEMSIELQAKLLRVLETQEFYKVGETKPSKVDVRIISATNRDLEKEAEKENFRKDLFYRIASFQVRLPSLNERQKDIRLLAEFFTRQFSLKLNKKMDKPGSDFIKALEQHQWKGNIRELRNVIERAVILSEETELTTRSLPFGFSDPVNCSASYTLADAEKKHIQKILAHTNGNKTKTADLLGIGLTTLYRKIEEYKIQ